MFLIFLKRRIHNVCCMGRTNISKSSATYNLWYIYNNGYKRICKERRMTFLIIPADKRASKPWGVGMTELPSLKQILLFVITLIPVWAGVAYLWGHYLSDMPFFTDYLLFTNLIFSLMTAFLVSGMLWILGDLLFFDWLKKRRR